MLPEPIQLWRCFSHWLGGMGIVLLGLAVLPLVGHGGMALYRAEFSGAKSEKLKPRIAETALSLWKLYVAFTVAEVVALRLAGMTWLEALCHAFSTLGTGGFSTRNASVGGFQSPAIEWIIIVFMLLAGVSFVQHYRLFVERRPRSFFPDFEVRAYLLVAVAAVALIAPTLIWFNGYDASRAIRGAAFQVSSHRHHHRLRHRELRALVSAGPDDPPRAHVRRGLHRLDRRRGQDRPRGAARAGRGPRVPADGRARTGCSRCGSGGGSSRRRPSRAF